MKQYVKNINEFFRLAEEEEEEMEKSPEEQEEEEEEDKENLEKEKDVFNVGEAEEQLEYYNDLIDSVSSKMGLKFEGPYSSQESTDAKIGDKTPLNTRDWNNVYFKLNSKESNAEIFIEFITDPDALDEYSDENGIHWPRAFVYKEVEANNEGPELIEKLEAKEIPMIGWLQKEFK